jgi:HK97 family phage major capsid protein
MQIDEVTRSALLRAASAIQLALSPRETRRYSLARAILALKHCDTAPHLREQAAFEFEASREIAKKLGREASGSLFVPLEVLQRPLGGEAAARALGTVPGSKGGYLVPVEQMSFVDVLRARSVCRRLGALSVGNLEGDVTIPRGVVGASVTWQAGDNTAAVPNDQTLGQLSMKPRTAIIITDVSEQLLKQTGGAAEMIVGRDLAGAIAEGVDKAALSGTGGEQPLGILNTAGIVTNQDASSASYAKILAFPQAAAAANAITDSPGWATNVAGSTALMQRVKFANTASPLWEGSQISGALVGFNAETTESLASGRIIFGSWSELVIGEWGVLQLDTDRGGTRFNSATVGIRAMWMVDTVVRRPQAFVAGTNLS